jgi:hypothetical protein
VKIRTRKTEQHTHIINGQYDRVGEDAVIGIAQGDDQRGHPVIAANASDNECARRTVEDRHHQFDDFEILLIMVFLAVGFDLGRHEANRPLAIPIRHAKVEIREHLVDNELQRAAIVVGAHVLFVERFLVQQHVGRNELDPRIDADGVEQASRDRAEEGLEEGVVRVLADEFGVTLLDGDPERLATLGSLDGRAELPQRAVNGLVVELDTCDGVRTSLLPVALFETARRPPRQLTEIFVVAQERIDELLRYGSLYGG